jgi:hypothetical protein
MYFMAMRYRIRITPFVLLLLLHLASPARPLLSDSTLSDSLTKKLVRDSLNALQEQSRGLYLHTSQGYDPFTVNGAGLFSANSPSPSEALAQSPLCVPVRFGLSNRLNRFLVYGNTAPITALSIGGPLLFAPFDRWSGSDDIFTTEISSVVLDPAGICKYAPQPGFAAAPEESIVWETGVFGGNVLAVRFVRPLSRRLSVNAFSNYRYLSGTRYSHDGNGISSFYNSLVSDSSVLSNRGYNPLVNDYTAGIRTTWSGTNGSEHFFGAKYADNEGEFPVDQPPSFDLPVVFTQSQYHSVLDIGSIGNRFGPVAVDLQGRYDASDLVRTTGRLASGGARSGDAANREMSFATRIGSPKGRTSDIALIYQGRKTVRRPFLPQETSAFDHSGFFEGSYSRGTGLINGKAGATAGAIAVEGFDSLAIAPVVSAILDLTVFAHRIRAYGARSALPRFIPYDTALFHAAPLLDRYLLWGGEVDLRRGAGALLLGVQMVDGIDTNTVLMAWPDGLAPYAQSRFSLLVAPRFGPWRGFTVESRSYFADEKPFVKARGTLTWSTHPEYTREFIDLSLCFDYWSERDPVSFAGGTDWNRPVYDLALECTAHVSAFRFFGKIDNLLNRKFAYVPGFYSPGLTFRWGIGWYLQK